MRAELAERSVADPSGRAAALNLARRMDRDPTSGAQNAAQLRQLLAELAPPESDSFDEVAWLRLSAAFKQRGWQLTDGISGFDLAEIPDYERQVLIAQVTSRALR